MKKYTYLFFALVIFNCHNLTAKDNNPIYVMIISGSNNHNWEQTTPQLESIFAETDLFSIKVTLRPDTIDALDLRDVDVIVSNWNSWPDNDFRWPEKTEKAITQFLTKGGGLVTFHASSSALYQWPEFKKFSTGAWIMNQTHHGKVSSTAVNIRNHEHPVTHGMSDFYIFDELWIDAEENPDFQILGTGSNPKIQTEGKSEQPTIMVGSYGKGRIFHTTLGHDARTMRSKGFRSLLQHGTEWAATGNVTQDIVQELKPENETSNYFWQESDTTLALLNGNQIVWKYNYNTKHGRPFLHPIFIGRNNITCLSPDDHAWHLGQWFCWKYINDVNYWEYTRGPFQSAGITEVEDIKIKKYDDFSARIDLDIIYYPFGGKKVMKEKRSIKIAAPKTDDRLQMDYDFSFEAVAEEVELNRTPVLGQENGQSWGGYAGISIRFSQDFMNHEYITPWNDNDSINRQTGDWLYMGFTGIDGKKVGSQIMVPPQSRRDGWAWYAINTESLPFYYFSPAYLYFKPLLMKKGDKIHLNYRILHLPGEVNKDYLSTEYQKYIAQKSLFK